MKGLVWDFLQFHYKYMDVEQIWNIYIIEEAGYQIKPNKEGHENKAIWKTIK